MAVAWDCERMQGCEDAKMEDGGGQGVGVSCATRDRRQRRERGRNRVSWSQRHELSWEGRGRRRAGGSRLAESRFARHRHRDTETKRQSHGVTESQSPETRRRGGSCAGRNGWEHKNDAGGRYAVLLVHRWLRCCVAVVYRTKGASRSRSELSQGRACAVYIREVADLSDGRRRGRCPRCRCRDVKLSRIKRSKSSEASNAAVELR
jgi:hypothetical protein